MHQRSSTPLSVAVPSEDGHARVSDEGLSGMQTEGVGRESPASLEVADDLVQPVIVPRDRVVAGDVPLDVLCQKGTHGIRVAAP